MNKIAFKLGTLLFSLTSAAAFAEEIPLLNREAVKNIEFIFPFQEKYDSHTSSIIETSPGQFLVVWKGGFGDVNIHMRDDNTGIWLARFDGKSWSEPQEVISSGKTLCWRPVLAKLPTGEILLFYRTGPTPRDVVSFIKRSNDGGRTWFDSEIQPAGIIGPMNSSLIVTPEGKLFIPSSIETGEPENAYKATALWVEISEDGGHHWKKAGPLEIPGQKFGAISPALFYDKEHNLRLLCRDRAHKIGGTGYIWTSLSKDGGNSWSELTKTSLPNPDSSIATVDLGEGKIVLFYNHSHTERRPLHVAVSLDGGDSWSKPYALEEKSGEFAAAMLASDGLIHVTYAFESKKDQRQIKHATLDPAKLLEAATRN